MNHHEEGLFKWILNIGSSIQNLPETFLDELRDFQRVINHAAHTRWNCA